MEFGICIIKKVFRWFRTFGVFLILTQVRKVKTLFFFGILDFLLWFLSSYFFFFFFLLLLPSFQFWEENTLISYFETFLFFYFSFLLLFFFVLKNKKELFFKKSKMTKKKKKKVAKLTRIALLIGLEMIETNCPNLELTLKNKKKYNLLILERIQSIWQFTESVTLSLTMNTNMNSVLSQRLLKPPRMVVAQLT